MTAGVYIKPAILAAIPRGRHAMIEASAGTGKTYTLEHLVVELILDAEVPLESILVVTYTERAASELRLRVRKKLEELLALRTQPEQTPEGAAVWRIDDRARARLQRAIQTFDLASISTIHAFCQSMLNENAFLGRRLFEEELVDGRIAFARAFIDALRRVLARDPRYLPYLEAWLFEHSLEELHQLLWECAQRRGELRPPFQPSKLDELMLSLASEAPSAELIKAEMRALKKQTNTQTAFVSRYAVLLELAARYKEDRNLPQLLVRVARAEKEHHGKFLSYLREKIDDMRPRDHRITRTFLSIKQLGELFVPLKSAVAETLLPPVKAEVRAGKAKRGELDFDDMLALLWSSLAGPRGDELASAIAARYSAALVDEFQDTDDIQWRIFERIFIDRPLKDRTLYVIGDPKQSIYGFRGADVFTYLRALEKIGHAGGTRVPLSENYRSTAALIEALNTLFDQKARDPFFTGDIRYEEPVRAARPAAPSDLGGAPVRVWSIAAAEGEELSPQSARAALGKRIAIELRSLLAANEVAPNEIFILTRTGRESLEVGRHLRSARIPHAFYKQEGLFQTPEAAAIHVLLSAVAAPEITSRRVRAWMGPFFEVPLESLPACLELPANHPLLERLHSWRALAKEKRYSMLFNRILEDSGILRRQLFFEDSERELTNYTHIFEMLHEEATRTHATLEELLHTLTAFIENRRSPEGENGNVQRLESERSAVQIMTMHKAKGLEARVVFLFGALQSTRISEVNVIHEGHERFLLVGSKYKKEAIEREQDDEDRRLLYVALTRAKERLYLPHLVGLPKFDGAYRHVNRALDRILESGNPLYSKEALFARAGDAIERTRPHKEALDAWKPPLELFAEQVPPGDLEYLRETRSGLVITSYSRMKASSGGYHAPDPIVDDRAAAVDVAALDPRDSNDLPGGSGIGRFLHEVLENVPLESFEMPFESWCVRKDVRAVFDDALKKHDVEARHLARAQELVWAGLGGPMSFSGIELKRGIAATESIVREMEFYYPLPETPSERGFIKGYIDLVFEHQGRIYLVDWKSDLLPSYADDALEVHCAYNYAMQAKLYTTALVKMLGVQTRADYDRVFGGTLYVFLRGLDLNSQTGVRFSRLSWSEVTK